MKFYYLLLLLFILNISATIAQQESIQKDDFTVDNQKIQSEDDVDVYLSSKQYQRKKYYLERRKNSDGSLSNIDKNNYQALRTYKKNNPNYNRSVHGSWSFLGPNDTNLGPGDTNPGGYQGRVNSIDFHPTNDQIIYLCTPNGGIWKTVNGGSTWSSLTDHLGLLSFTDLEISPTDPNTIYAITGDGDPVNGPAYFGGGGPGTQVWSAGILKTTDGGVTWNFVNYELPIQTVPYKLLMHPTNPNIQFLATQAGIYKTTNGWNDGYEVLTVIAYDIEFKPGDPNIMYTCGKKSIRRSVELGESGTWLPVTDPDFVVLTEANRIELAVTPDFPSYVGLHACKNGTLAILISGLDGASNTWSIRDSSTNIINHSGPFNIAFAIDPNDYTKFYGGGVDIWKSTVQGATGTWTNIGTNKIHADLHDIAFKNGKLYAATDGGLQRSDDEGVSWTDLSAGLQITEVYRLSGSESNPELFFIGNQDNGTLRRTAGTTFDHQIGGDGAVSIINYNNNDIVYAMRQNGVAYKSTNGGDNFSDMPIPGQGAWITPMIMDPVNSARLFVGKDTIYRSNSNGDSGSWENIGVLGSGPINNLAQGTTINTRIYASRGSVFYRSSNALANPASSVEWTTLGDGLPDEFITDIAVDPYNEDHVIVTLGNYKEQKKVYESLEGGNDNTWTNISGSLPNVPILTIAYHDDGSGLDRMYIGTDIGVFYRDDNIGDWIYFSNFMPAVPVDDIYINTVNNTIAAATYGRGLWRSDLFSNCLNSLNVASTITLKGELHYTYLQSITSAATISAQPGTAIYYKAGDFIDLKPGFLAPAITTFEAQIGDCPY